jgi:hypothetical protein
MPIDQRVSNRWLPPAVIVASALVLVALLVNARRGPFVDYVAYRAGAAALMHGERLYGPALAWRDAGFSPLFPRQSPTDGFPFVYPPVFALAFSPLLLLPDAGGVWLLVVMGALIGTSAVLTGLLLPTARAPRLAIVLGVSALLVLFHPLRSILVTGQADSVLILLSAMALAAFARGRDARAAVWLALAAAIKPTLVILALYLVWKRAYRAFVLFGALAGVLLVVPFVTAGGVQAVRDYAAVARYWSGPGFAVSPINQAPYGYFLRLFAPNAFTQPVIVAPWLATAMRSALAIVSLAAWLSTVRRERRLPVHVLALEFGALIVAMLLVGPLSEAGNYGYLVIPFVALAVAVAKAPASRARLVMGAMVAMVYGYLSLPGLITLDMAFYAYWQAPVAFPRALLTGMHMYGLFALAVLLVQVMRMAPQGQAGRATNQ